MTPKKAIISVYDKSGVIELATCLRARGVEILSSGGTHQQLVEQGIEATKVADYTGFPEMLGGKVKTLHPKIHGGLLGTPAELAEITEQDIPKIDFLIVNFYATHPHSAVNSDAEIAEIIQQIDIGGPTMVRSAAKNYAHTVVLTSPEDYADFIKEFSETGTINELQRLKWAQKAFQHIARYDAEIVSELDKIVAFKQGQSSDELPEQSTVIGNKIMALRYGENPHQPAALYKQTNLETATLQVLKGDISFNNLVDAHSAAECVSNFAEPACTIVKHATPCGVAVKASLKDAYETAFKTDPTSAFGGVMAFNRPVEIETAAALGQHFVELIVAPHFSSEALQLLQTRKKLKLLQYQKDESAAAPIEMKTLFQNYLAVQRQDQRPSLADAECKTPHELTEKDWQDLEFAWKVCFSVKSNAIVLAQNQMTIGIGSGQPNRIGAAKIAIANAEHFGFSPRGTVMASDGFIPFRDLVDYAAQFGIRAIVQPGGSVRDGEVIEAAIAKNIAMVFAHRRHFKH